eukprot:g16489.t1
MGAHLTFRDFLRISSRALRDSEKEHRRKEFQAECEVIHAANYGMLQVEDMRELHGSFCALKSSMPNRAKANFDAMQELTIKLNYIKPGREIKDAQPEVVPFATFLSWMRDVRDLGIEGFSSVTWRGSDITMED